MMEYYQFFVDAWRYFKRFYQTATDRDDWYGQMVEEADKLCQTYKERPFAIDILCAIQNELERIAKSRS